ncbi:MAG: hypothetical protein AAFW47_03475 [Pseudomonadota bacterium]
MRLLQIVALAAFALIAIKVVHLITSGALDNIAVVDAVAQENDTAAADVPQDTAAAATGGDEADTSASTRDTLLQRLGQRREELDKRERDLKLREQLLEASEARLKAQLEELKQQQSKEGDEGEAASSKKDLVVIYESMKPKDAAKIFDVLSLEILHSLATSMNPRKMSAILAEMEVKAAERLTVEIALRAAGGAAGQKKRKLTKIGG